MAGKTLARRRRVRVDGFDLKSFLGQEPCDELAELDVVIDYQDLLAGQLRLRFHDLSHSIGLRVRCGQEMLSDFNTGSAGALARNERRRREQYVAIQRLEKI